MSIDSIVIADISDATVAGEWVAWLRDGHLADVLKAGATQATLTRQEPSAEAPLRFEVRYRFPSMAAFSVYEKAWAPRLRAEGLARFPPERGVTLRRMLAEVLAVVP